VCVSGSVHLGRHGGEGCVCVRERERVSDRLQVADGCVDVRERESVCVGHEGDEGGVLKSRRA